MWNKLVYINLKWKLRIVMVGFVILLLHECHNVNKLLTDCPLTAWFSC